MSQPSPKGRDVEDVLKQLGFEQVHQAGSHAKYKKAGHPTHVELSYRGAEEIPKGTFGNILKQIGLSKVEFWGILGKGPKPKTFKKVKLKDKPEGPASIAVFPSHRVEDGSQTNEMDGAEASTQDESMQISRSVDDS